MEAKACDLQNVKHISIFLKVVRLIVVCLKGACLYIYMIMITDYWILISGIVTFKKLGWEHQNLWMTTYIFGNSEQWNIKRKYLTYFHLNKVIFFHFTSKNILQINIGRNDAFCINPRFQVQTQKFYYCVHDSKQTVRGDVTTVSRTEFGQHHPHKNRSDLTLGSTRNSTKILLAMKLSSFETLIWP